MLSEEALESRNKNFRNYREKHTRKMSRNRTMRDLFNVLLYSSDPIITALSKTTSTTSRFNHAFTSDVLQLLSEPQLAQQQIHYNKDSYNSDSEND